MSTVQEVWGFSDILAVNVEVSDFCKAMNAAAVSRNIAPNVPSDALDLSRDIMLDEAAQSLGAECEIVDTTLRVWPKGVTLDWAQVAKEASAHDRTEH